MDYMLDPNYRGHLKTVASHLIPSLSVFNTSGVVIIGDAANLLI